ncbi:TetR/AcrR family transcriptional regulator [Metabacillus endolithicus]|uniref:TetR/AcrR family transcriptional regulator n=1 Tax=Metabacillus endolithicus TaxID=1535204 RepID=A0ABW5BTP0_9BACI|nr:TetR/AcrR family transcriptional regulator [Metabacillus endolithicus]UPG63829.1 TetR/AcrR family transcriptional regulator [Metabacillus endolithicus]
MDNKMNKRTLEMKKMHVLQAATELFSVKSYESTTMSDISKKADVSFGSVASYFGNKESLFAICIEQPLGEFVTRFLDFNLSPDSFVDELEKMIKGHIILFSKMKVYLRLIVQVIAQHERFPNEFNVVVQHTRLIQNGIAKFIRKGQELGKLMDGDSEKLSVAYVNFLFGTVLSYAFNPSQEEQDEFILIAIRMFGPII